MFNRRISLAAMIAAAFGARIPNAIQPQPLPEKRSHGRDLPRPSGRTWKVFGLGLSRASASTQSGKARAAGEKRARKALKRRNDYLKCTGNNPCLGIVRGH